MNDEIEIIESIPTKIRYKGIVWIPEPKKQKIIEEIPKKIEDTAIDNINTIFTVPVEKHAKKPYFVKWLEKSKNVGAVFTLDEFYSKHPKHKKDIVCRRRVQRLIADMIADERILQIGKDRFKLVQ